MPATVVINKETIITLYQIDLYHIFEYVKPFVNSPELYFEFFLSMDSGLDIVSFEELTSSEFNHIYRAMVKALDHFKASGNSFSPDNRALKEWENIMRELEKDERFEPI